MEPRLSGNAMESKRRSTSDKAHDTAWARMGGSTCCGRCLHSRTRSRCRTLACKQSSRHAGIACTVLPKGGCASCRELVEVHRCWHAPVMSCVLWRRMPMRQSLPSLRFLQPLPWMQRVSVNLYLHHIICQGCQMGPVHHLAYTRYAIMGCLCGVASALCW